MRYEPIKEKIGSAIGTSRSLRKLYYLCLGILLLRAWHVKRAIKKIFRERKFQRVLDAGCGPGQYSYYISRKFKSKVTGVDIIKEEVDKSNRFAQDEKLSGAIFKVADLSSSDLSELSGAKYDLIISVDVMEHIKDDVAVFRNFATLLNNSGTVLISTPTAGNDHDHEEHSFIDEHFRSGYTPEDISEKLTAAGLKVENISFIYGFGGSIYWKLSMKIPITLLNKSYLYFALLPFYYVVAFPISLVFMAMDYYFPPKGGGGLLVVARKA